VNIEANREWVIEAGMPEEAISLEVCACGRETRLAHQRETVSLDDEVAWVGSACEVAGRFARPLVKVTQRVPTNRVDFWLGVVRFAGHDPSACHKASWCGFELIRDCTSGNIADAPS
jgi:hypothetical protein